MANKLGLSNEVKEIKLGKSFGKDRQGFHTFRYDFMPASLDTTKRATVDIGDGHQVTVTVPHIEGSGTANTVFKGSKKPYQKECVLIIDHVTGEITLEKLSCNVQLKKTRAEGSSKVRSVTPVDNGLNNKKSPMPSRLSPQEKPHSTFGERTSPNQKFSPLPKSPVSHQTSPNGSSNHSMPSFNSFTPKPTTPMDVFSVPVVNDKTPGCVGKTMTLPSDVTARSPSNRAPEIGVLSSSSSSSSSEGLSDLSDNEESTKSIKSKGVLNGLSSSPKKKEGIANHLPSNSLSMPTTSSLPSMPKFSQLSEDLKLSESDSD